MKEGRVIAVLLVIIVLFSVILGIKITNNMPEKQKAEITNNYNINNNTNNNVNTTVKDEATQLLNDYFKGREKYYEREEKLEKYSEIYSKISLWVIIVSSYIIFYKLGIDSKLIKKTVIVNVGMFLPIPIVGFILSIIFLVLYVKLLLEFGKELEITTLMCFIPFVIQWKLGTYFGKSTLFKLGLLFVPVIFFPILALTAES